MGLVLLAASPALAQRGADFVQRDTPQPDSTTGFPGLLDTNLVDRGKFVIDAPLLSARYGITRNWTVGTNTLSLLPIKGGHVSGLLETRYRLRSTARMSWVISAYGGVSGFDYQDGEEPRELEVAVGMLVSSVAYRITPRDQLTATIALLRLNMDVKGENSVMLERNHVAATLTALTYQHAFGSRVALSATALFAPVVAGELDTSRSTTNLALRGALHERILTRGMVHYRKGSWLLGAGVLVAVAKPIPIPWLSLAWSST